MMIFKLLFVALMLVELTIGFAVKWNYKGIRDRLIEWFTVNDVRDFIATGFADKWITQIFLLLILFLLCII